MEALINRQIELVNNIKKIQINFGKDSQARKTAEYLQSRLDALDTLWGEFTNNHVTLSGSPKEANQYFSERIYDQAKEIYTSARNIISCFGKEDTTVQRSGEVESLLSIQRTHFRALDRFMRGIDLDNISEKWEIEDELRNMQHKWNIIDEQHVKIDNLLRGGDSSYEDDLMRIEKAFKNMKRLLNQKLSSNLHIQQYTPQLEIPVFTGKYTHWPTFYDLFSESIHNNNSISKAQKLQHLKSRLRGEAERLIQHLHISAENYDTAWELLVHRYNNPQVLFSKHIEIFLNQHNINKQSSYELKKLYDTSTECLHAIHNLGVDTTTWDPLLVHLLCKKLDPQTYTDYKEHRTSPRSLPTMDEFMGFLEGKFMALEPVYSKDKGTTSTTTPANPKREAIIKYQQVFATHLNRCPACNLQHDLFKCKKFYNMTSDNQLKLIAKYSICKNCLYKHFDKPCTSDKRCKQCNGQHNTIIHEACAGSLPVDIISSSHISQPGRQTNANQALSLTSGAQQSNQKGVYHIASENTETLLPTAIVKVRAADGTYMLVRALLDQAAQVSLISEDLVQKLGLKRYHPLSSAAVSGIDLCPKKSKGEVSIQFQSMYGDYHFEAEAYIVSKVAYALPSISFRRENLSYLDNLELSDPSFNVSQRIDLLLHGDIYSQVIMEGLIKGPDRTPIAQQTKLGWIISGNVKPLSCYVITKTKLSNTTDLSKFWEIEDINHTTSKLTEDEQSCEDHYQSTTQRRSDGRYVVALPMKQNYQHQLGSSDSKAKAQFRQLEKKLAKNQEYSDSYKQFMREYHQLDHMRRVSTNYQANYLPHHGVLKLDSDTTKLRIVFNASVKTSTGYSLNDLMHGGPNLQRDLQSLIINWRKYKFVIIADIEKMFRQILIREEDRHLQTIIWRESPDEPLQNYQLTTVTYGTKAAPFLAMRTLKQLAQDEADKYPLAAAAIETSFYMDDLLTGQNCLEKTKELQKELVHIFQSAKMNLRKWASNHPSLLDDLQPEQQNNHYEFKGLESRKTLGLNPISDCFTYQDQHMNTNECLTKRQLLSEISKIFDPLGWLSPLSIRAKLLFQKTWNIKMEWDDKVSADIQKEWVELSKDFSNISDFKIPRYLGNTQQSAHLHAFCDASEKSYACVIYLVTINDKGDYTSQLVAAKTKLAPLAKKVSLPRLELCGAHLLSQRLSKILESFSGMDIKLHAWSDSMIVLGWLHGDISRWKPFVANRVQQIINIIPASCWRHVRSESNPADCATRGITRQQLLASKLWWRGPEWITTMDTEYQHNIIYQCPDVELKDVCVYATLQQPHFSILNELLHRHSSLTRVAKVLGWILRFITCVCDKQNKKKSTSLSSAELHKSYTMIIKEIQGQEFREDPSQPRVQDGKDAFVQVETPKSYSDGIKRPVSKLVPSASWPVREIEDYPVQLSQRHASLSSQNQTADEESKNIKQRARVTLLNLKNFLITILLMFSIFISPSSQQGSTHNYNISSFKDNRSLFFDKIADMQYIKEEWKLVVYYNMSTYWHSLPNIEDYVDHLQEVVRKQNESQYQGIMLQLQQEMNEIKHYNSLLAFKNRRKKRGLINGVGYLANSLFGILDERFADQYTQDLEKITSNENHLRILLRNQTSVIESEYNILRRNEEVMNKQFNFIKKRLQNISSQIKHVQFIQGGDIYITSSALTASIILSNLRRMQQTLIDTITDISHGRIDIHLLMPDQLQHELNIISGQLNRDLSLPVYGDQIRDLYKLLKVAARVHGNYLIIEIKIPLLSSTTFELSKIIPVPQIINNNHTRYILPRLSYIAYDFNKDTAFLLSENDLQACVYTAQQVLICTLDKTMYDLNIKTSLCNIKLLNADTGLKARTSMVTSCENQWIKLHNKHDWLFACCGECHVRIYCTAGMTIQDIKGTGIITINKGCSLKGESFSIYAQDDFFNEFHIRQEFEAPKISSLNDIFNTSVPDPSLPSISDHHSERVWNELRTEISNIKQSSENQLTIHDVHHYTLLYIIVTVVLLAAAIGISVWIKRRSHGRPADAGPEAPAPQHRQRKTSVSNNENSVIKESVFSVTTGTSPVLLRSRVEQ